MIFFFEYRYQRFADCDAHVIKNLQQFNSIVNKEGKAETEKLADEIKIKLLLSQVFFLSYIFYFFILSFFHVFLYFLIYDI